MKKIPSVFSWLYTIVMVFISWILFDAESIQVAATRISAMFGGQDIALMNSVTEYYLTSYGLLLVVGCFGATPLLKKFVLWLKENMWRR